MAKKQRPEATSQPTEGATITLASTSPVPVTRHASAAAVSEVDRTPRLQATGPAQPDAVDVEVSLGHGELAELRGVLGCREGWSPAYVVRLGLSRVVGSKYVPSPPESLRDSPDTNAGRVQVRLPPRAMTMLVERGSDRFGCTTDSERIRWAMLRLVLKHKPEKVRQRMWPAPPSGTRA